MNALSGSLLKCCVVAASCALLTSTARANVYATDIQVNGNLTNVVVSNGTPVSISYRLNQTADLGVTVNIMSGASVVASIPGGTNMGRNTVSWTPATGGNFGVNITAAATGFPIWTQISVDTNAGMPAFDPQGLDVDKNTNSPYYGRVVMSCAQTGSGVGAQIDGLYKMNADGSQADEGWYGYGGYTNDDYGDTAVGQMPNSGGFNPLFIRIGDDDRIYWNDNTAVGAIIACDILASTNNGFQVVIDEGTNVANAPGFTVQGTLYEIAPSNNYSKCPDFGDLLSGFGEGIQQFDITATATSHGAVWLVDTGDNPNWGVWMFHLTNGAADPADNIGTKAVATGGALATTGSGVMIDSNLDIFIGQNISSPGATNARCVSFHNWNGGQLPPEAGGYKYALTNGAAWQSGTNSTSLLNIRDTVIDSRGQPKYVALPMSSGSTYNGGIGVLNAANGSFVTATNGTSIQTLTNIDYLNQYTCAAWDGVGNLYGASTSANLWRVWSPPGAGTNTTLAVVQIVVPGAPTVTITGISAVPTSPGCANVIITFSATGNPAASQFQLVSASAVSGPYAPVNTGVTITGGSGTYQASFSNCSTQFYKIAEAP